MNWEALGAVGEFFGGIVVIVSLIYFGRQLRQSNEHAEANAYVEWNSAWNRLLNDLVTDQNVQEAIRRGFTSFYELEKHEQALFQMRIGALVNHWLVAAELKDKQLIPDELYYGCLDFVIAILATPGGMEYWEHDAEFTPRGQELMMMIKNNVRKVKPVTEVLPWWS